MIEQYKNKIINADCLDILKQLPDKCIDLVLTDPPYGIAYNNKKMHRKSQRDFKDIENDNMELDYVHLIKEFLRISKNKVIVWGWNCFFTTGCFPIRGRTICWDKRTKLSADNLLGSPFELAWVNNESGYDKIYRIMHGGVVNADGANEARIHPTQKPITLFERCILDFSKEGEIVFDPFSGSGTTAIASYNTKRNFICIEKDFDYWKASCKRLEDHQRQGVLF